MSQENIDYYRQRAITERALAQASEQLEVRRIHEELARQYEALVQQAGRRPILRIVDKPRPREVAAA